MDVPLSAADVLRLAPRAVLSHEEAARHWGIALVEDLGVHRVTVPRNWSHVALEGWEVVRRPVPPQEVIERDGFRWTSPRRTVADLSRLLALPHAVAAADSALRARLLTTAVLTDVLLGARGRDAGALRDVGRLLDPRSGSVLESLLRVLLLTSELPAPRTQYEVLDGIDVVARVDFAWPEQRLVVEADGFAFHSDRDAYRKDRARMNELERLGWRVLRFTWEDVVGRPGHILGLVRSCLLLAA